MSSKGKTGASGGGKKAGQSKDQGWQTATVKKSKSRSQSKEPEVAAPSSSSSSSSSAGLGVTVRGAVVEAAEEENLFSDPFDDPTMQRVLHGSHVLPLTQMEEEAENGGGEIGRAHV